ncbi:ATP-binding cassette domain-containing protein [Streptomyces huiliensis]|uniref:ATP-binding cassette domain-containing protein n=1 Tax=Streptomyces huiliensis TaxID=2876027 RepID=UPI001CBAACE2|nr:ABC transporter ATP-binding protein [Streptomyces huiliensis]
MPEPGRTPSTARQGLRFLAARRAALARLAGWSVLEAGHTFTLGYALARALDRGFLAGREATGLGWLGLAALAVLAGAYGTGRTYRATADLVEPLRDGLVRRVVGRALVDGDGAAVSRLTHQVEIARDTFAGLVMVSRSFVFTAGGALAGLCALAPALLLAVVPPLLLGLLLFLLTLRVLARRQEAVLVADEALARSLDEVARGLRDITAGGAERRVAAATGALVDAERDAARALARWSVVRVAALALAGRLPIVLLLALAPWLLDHGATPGAFVGALAYVTQSLLPAVQELVHGLGASGARLAVVIRRLTAGTGSGTGRPDGPGPGRSTGKAGAAPDAAPRECAPHSPHPSLTPALEFRGVTFAYGPHAAPVVRSLDLSVASGARLAVVGPSGVGKSTLAGLAAGLLVPAGGEVVVGGLPARGAAARAGRVLIPQEAYVFSGTLGENLGYLRADPVPEDELWAAAEAVGMGELAERLGGFGTVVAPAGLSAGERQWIALARAYLSPAPLALLDEATCHLDPAAEARAEDAFARRPGGTLVVVAHRAASALRADRVLVMDGPHTVCGEHAELLRVSPLYRDLMADADAGGPSDPAGSLGDSYRVDPVARAGLPGDRAHVVAHGAVRQVQAAGDLPDAGALGGE